MREMLWKFQLIRREMEPKVSVVIATYNRSNVLTLAIQSVIKSSFQEWELIVVSDASTDDTKEVVNSFSDSRIKFVELSTNSGNQSTPNNEGIKQASGKYIAFLSHDDLWFPDHLERVTHYLEQNDADLVLSQGFNILVSDGTELISVFPDNLYNPYFGYSPASLWLIKKEVIERAGGWQMHTEIRTAPSQDLLIRLFRAKCKMMVLPVATAIIFPSGRRAGCYKNRDSGEQENYIELLNNPTALRIKLLEESLNGYLIKEKINSYKIGYLFYRLVIGVLKNTCRLFDVNPVYFSALLHHKRKGLYIKKLKKIRGLR